MPAAARPRDEAARLAALNATGLLDRRPDPRIRVITQMAADLLKRPAAALSLIKADNQVFRPGVGLSVSGTERDAAFCAHAILEPDRALVVEDARLDQRFADNPLVTGEMGLRFYAGVPVRASNGQPIGALCVLDTKPGKVTPGQIEILGQLAHEIENIVRRKPPTLREPQALLRDLRAAVAGGAFHLNWQPVADAADLSCVGYEVLARWNRPGHGPIAPDVFVPIAEGSGLIRSIDSLVLNRAIAEAARWPSPLRVSVNVSARWFSHKTALLAGVVSSALVGSGIAPNRLTIEVTERMLINDPDRALLEMRQLKKLGVLIALDDFGTGYASLGYLEMFPFDVVKLDKTFVRGLGTNRRAEAVARAVIRLGHDLGMLVCAEGIEKPRQLEFLRGEACDMVQGYLIGRPAENVAPVGERVLSDLVLSSR